MAAKSKHAGGKPADRVRFILKAVFGGNQTKMAETIGIAQPVVSKVVNSQQEPGSRFLQALSKHPRVNPLWVMSGEGDPLLAERDPSTRGGWPIPVALALLPGPLANHQDLLSTRVEFVPGVSYRDSIYAVEAAVCLPAVQQSDEHMSPNDLVFIDADPARWRKNLQLLHGKLCVVRLGPADSTPLSLRRVWLGRVSSSASPNVFTFTDEQLAEQARDMEEERKMIEKYGKERRGLDIPSLKSNKQSAKNSAEKVPIASVYGVGLQLIRNL